MPASVRRSQREARRRSSDSLEEEEAPKNNRQNGRRGQASTSARQPARRTREVEEEADEEENDDEEEVGDEDGGEVDDDGEVSDEGGQVWGLKKTKKLPVSEAIRKAAADMDPEELKRKALDLVRLALFTEHSRAPLRRDDITKKVLTKSHNRIFPVIFNRAQKILRFSFGYEMVELRGRGMDNEQIIAATQSQRRRNLDADALARGANAASSKTYILNSILPPKLVARITQPTSDMSNALQHSDQEATKGIYRDEKGVLLDWNASESDLNRMGLTYLILSVILLNGRLLADDQLRSYLRRLSLPPGKQLPRSLQPNPDALDGWTLERYLEALEKQGYLERVMVQGGQATAALIEASLAGRRTQVRGNLRSKTSTRTVGEADAVREFEWRWGARAEAEIGEVAVSKFVSEIFLGAEDEEDVLMNGRDEEGEGGDDSDDDDEPAPPANGAAGGQETATTRRKRRKVQLQRDIQRAAGSVLIS